MNKFPNDWLFKIIAGSMTTAFTFYLFEFVCELSFFEHFTRQHEKFYIYTFLGIQAIISGFFYFILQSFLGKLLFNRIKKFVSSFKSKIKLEDIRVLVKIKELIILLFSLQIQMGNLEEDDFKGEIFILDKENEIKSIVSKVVKWFVLAIHLTLTSILVYELSAWYIVPALIVVIIILLLFLFGVVIAVENISTLEKIRRTAYKLNYSNK